MELLGLSPGCLRAGGATRFFRLEVDISRIRFLGRWRNLATLDHYIQEASACMVLLEAQLTLHAWSELLQSTRILRRALLLHWSQLYSRAQQWR